MEVATNYPALKSVIKEPEQFSKPLSKLEAVYNSMEIGAYNDETLTRISNDGLIGILTEYKNKVNDEIESSGIKSKRLKGILLQSYDEAAEDLRNAVNALVEEVGSQKQAAIKARVLSRSLIMSGFGFEKIWGESKNPTDLYKILKIGKNSWISTECGKSWGFEYSAAEWRPGNGDVYLYAKCPMLQSEPAQLVVAYEPLPNTNTHYLVLVKTGKYEEVNFSNKNI